MRGNACSMRMGWLSSGDVIAVRQRIHFFGVPSTYVSRTWIVCVGHLLLGNWRLVIPGCRLGRHLAFVLVLLVYWWGLIIVMGTSASVGSIET